MASQYLTWDVLLKFAIILITAVLGFWDEIREHLLKSEAKNNASSKEKDQDKRSSKHYIIGLLFLLVLTLMGEFFDTRKKIDDENTAAEHLKNQADSAHVIDSNLKETLKNTATSLGALKNLKGKADSIRQNEHDILDSTNRQLDLVNRTSMALSNFSNDSKNKFSKVINPIRTVNIYAEFEVANLSKLFPDLSALLKRLSKIKGQTIIYIEPYDTTVYNSHAFKPFKIINGQISFLPSLAKQANKLIYPDDYDKTNISLQYVLKNYSDSLVYNHYADQYQQKNSAVLMSPNPSQMRYIYNYDRDQLEIVCKDFKMIYIATNNSDISSPQDLIDPNIRNKFTLNMCFYISNYYGGPYEEQYFFKNINHFNMTFNNDVDNDSFYFDSLKLSKFLKDEDNQHWFVFPLQAFNKLNIENTTPSELKLVQPVNGQGDYLK